MGMKRPKMAEIAAAVEDEFGLVRGELRQRTRRPEVRHPRQVAMWIMHETRRFSSTQIATYFDMHHTTVLHAIGKLKARIGDEELQQTKKDVQMMCISN